ncbi:hypothetical protein [Salsuginibacillus kocurii]|uniref:hypothetical protein n=1 Tax=Salsuginibacillus kocurii TaxID=427078 RepID=UPI00037EA074|nr:hypothetical protein [Salsuginibacillus kocurii]
MSELTTRELSFIEDEIRAEALCAKTMNWCASGCDDPDLRATLEELAEKHQHLVKDLSQYFNQAGDLH